MIEDIRNRDLSKVWTFRQKWVKSSYDKLRRVYDPDEVSNESLKEYLLKTYDERNTLTGRFFNNVTRKNTIMTLEQFIDTYLNMPYILSGYTTLFKNQDDSINIGAAALEFLLDSRSKYKAKMQAAEYGSNEYIYYRILQLTYKVLANSYYGILGEKNSIFYNSFVQNSITMTGQDLITASIISMENFLEDNVDFKDTDDMVEFVNNILREKHEYNIVKYIDRPISSTELKEYFIGKCLGSMDTDILDKIVDNMNEEQIALCFYKNKITDLIANTWFEDKMKHLVEFEYKETPDPAMVDELNEFKKIVIDFCFYDNIFEDRYKRSMKDIRKSIITIDTDSNFINLNRYIKLESKRLSLDTSNEVQQMTLMNIFVSITTDVLKQIFWTLTTSMGLIDRCKPIIEMKSEITYKRILLTRNKKSYAGLEIAEFGKLLKKPNLDMKGLAIRKTTVPKKLRREFTNILKHDILEAPIINLKEVLSKYDKLDDEIEEKLSIGNTEYTLPKNIESIETYKEPTNIEPVRAALLWNAIEPDKQIVPPEKINMLKLNAALWDGLETMPEDIKNTENTETTFEWIKLNVSSEVAELYKNNHSKYLAILETTFGSKDSTTNLDISRFGVSCIALPKGITSIPKYLIPFIDLETMVNKNMTNGYIILESLGVICEEVKTTQYKSNIVSI